MAIHIVVVDFSAFYSGDRDINLDVDSKSVMHLAFKAPKRVYDLLYAVNQTKVHRSKWLFMYYHGLDMDEGVTGCVTHVTPCWTICAITFKFCMLLLLQRHECWNLSTTAMSFKVLLKSDTQQRQQCRNHQI